MDEDMAVSMEKQAQEPGQFDAEQWSVEAAKAAMFEELLDSLKLFAGAYITGVDVGDSENKNVIALIERAEKVREGK